MTTKVLSFAALSTAWVESVALLFFALLFRRRWRWLETLALPVGVAKSAPEHQHLRQYAMQVTA